jgi:uncharacterized protein YkuJ
MGASSTKMQLAQVAIASLNSIKAVDYHSNVEEKKKKNFKQQGTVSTCTKYIKTRKSYVVHTDRHFETPIIYHYHCNLPSLSSSVLRMNVSSASAARGFGVFNRIQRNQQKGSNQNRQAGTHACT